MSVTIAEQFLIALVGLETEVAISNAKMEKYISAIEGAIEMNVPFPQPLV